MPSVRRSANDPAPSRLSYRIERLRLTPLFRLGLRAGLPLVAAFVGGSVYFADADRADAFHMTIASLREEIETRPEFMVNLMAVEGASATTEEDIREIFPYDFPVSSFDMDLAHVQQMIDDLPPVRATTVRIQNGGVLSVNVTERTPVALWRAPEGLLVIDAEGVPVAEAAHRGDHPDLPLLAGRGAEAAVDEALALLRAAAPLTDDLRGLVRVGERRWDVALAGDKRILLPAENPIPALERVIFLNETRDLLARDVIRVDMRLPARPTIQMSEAALDTWLQVSTASVRTD